MGSQPWICAPSSRSHVLAVILPATFAVSPLVLAGTATAANRETFLTTEPGAADPAASEAPKQPQETGPSGQVAVPIATPYPTPTPAPTASPAAPPTPAPTLLDVEYRPAAPRLGPGGEVRVFGAMHDPTFGVALAFDWAFRRAAIGLQADYAAWLDFDGLGMHPGAFHLAATGQHRIPLGRLSLRQRLAVGPAILLAERGTHRPGTTGLFFEAAPLGLEVHTRISRLTFVFEAFSLAISAPALGPDPAVQVQYRATLGLRF